MREEKDQRAKAKAKGGGRESGEMDKREGRARRMKELRSRGQVGGDSEAEMRTLMRWLGLCFSFSP